MDDRACCFTGHRPSKLPWGYDTASFVFLRFKNRLDLAVAEMAARGCTCFYTGMAMGTDLWAADAALALKALRPELRLIAVCPCRDQAENWRSDLRAAYEQILTQADETVVLGETYTPGCMHLRNRYMVERCGHLIAVYDGYSPGGTKSTLALARRRGLDIIIVDPNGNNCK